MICRETAEFLRTHDNYLILTHKRPDGDTIGSAVALREILLALGKTAWLLPAYDATALFAPWLEGRTAPEGFAPDTVVSVDVAGLGLLPDNAAPYRDRIDLAIDHHPSNDGFAIRTQLEADRAACGEILYALAAELGVMNQTVADALYMAVSTDTGCFVYANTTANTHRVAAALMDAGADYRALNKAHFRTKTSGRMRLEGLILRELRLYQEGTLAVAPVTLDMMAEAGAGRDDCEDIAAFIGQMEGVRISATLRELTPGRFKASLRTVAGALDASAACARLGGGGHKFASACEVSGTVDQVEQMVLSAIDAQWTEENHG